MIYRGPTHLADDGAVARDYDVSRTWVQQLCKRYLTQGAAAFEPRSRRPHHNPQAVGADLEERIVRLRKSLDKQGYDAGAATIAAHLTRDPHVTKVPSDRRLPDALQVAESPDLPLLDL
jgi:Helix-turn-helix domain